MKQFFVLIFSMVLSIVLASAGAQAESLRRRTFLNDGFIAGAEGFKVAFFDADSTLRVSLSGSVSANGPRDVYLLPWLETKIRQLNEDGYLVAIVSNQGGVKQGIVTMETADAALAFTTELLAARDAKARVHYFDFAEGGEPDRKPGRGMADRLDAALRAKYGRGIDYKSSFMVGDSAYKKGVDQRPDGRPGTHFSNADRKFAETLGIPFHEPNDFFGWRAFGIDVFEAVDQVRAFEAAHSCRRLFAR